MIQAQKSLMISYVGYILFVALIVFAYESGMAEQGSMAADTLAQYWLAIVMELLLCTIPLALYLFKYNKVVADLQRRKEKALLLWGMVRMDMLTFPMIANTFFYEMTLSPTFGYLAIIYFICLFFITPSRKRCQQELGIDDNKEK